uniref:MADS43 n=1 Tax=Hippophae rhamnoides TaxID=193516 RepID=A0AAU7LJF6_9ROSA
MVRGKTQMKRIENSTSRQVTFSKRRTGLMKKAFELSVLCDVEVALIIFSPRGKLYEFSSSSVQATIERYKRHTKGSQTNNKPAEQNLQHLKHEAVCMMEKIEFLEVSKRRYLGEGLESCSMDELQQIERQLERSVSKIRARKNQVFEDHIQKLKEKEMALAAENAQLRGKCFTIPVLASKEHNEKENLPNRESSPSSEVETELYIGLPETRMRRFIPQS